MKILRVLNSSGDRVFRFDDEQTSAQAREEAQALFVKMLSTGAVAFKVNRSDGRPDQKVSDFSQVENETIIVPRMVGG
jgi:hypothetical protein